jgi:tRNA threonylcarbamoyladenosine biosynthesis protein TsaB
LSSTRAASSTPEGGSRPAVIGFDTATEDTAVCAARRGEVLYESQLGLSEKGSPLHTTALLEEVDRAATAAGGWEAIEAIAVGVGPGSFTGLRVGLSTARALGLSCEMPVRGVCTLDALGRGLGQVAGGASRLAVIDAKRGEAFAALYTANGERLWEPLVDSPSGLAERVGALGENPVGAGSGAVRFRDELASRGVEIPDDVDPVHRVAARHICALATSGQSDDESGPVAPIYLRPPDAQRWRERDTSQAGR